MTKWLRAFTLRRLVILITFIAVFVISMRAPLDHDTFWHLRAGQWQVEHRALLQVDVFSHTRQGEPWINHSWLSQIILYGMYAALGDPGLALYMAILASAGMFFVYRQLSGDPMVRGLVIVLSAAAAAIFWSPRPQMMSFFLSTVILYLLWLYQKRGIDRLWLIPPIFLAWANLHGGFAIGFILLTLALVGDTLRWLSAKLHALPEEGDLPTLNSSLRLVVIGLVSAAVVSVNPYGPALLLYPFRTVGIGALQDYIQEWASPNFHNPQTWPFIWMLLGTLVAVGLSGKRLDWRDTVMVAGTGYSALLAQRNIPTFAIVAAPVLSHHISEWLAQYSFRLNWDRRPRTAGLAAANVLLLALTVIGALVWVVSVLNPVALTESRRERFPVDAVEFLREERYPGPIFNSYNWGGYLIWEARDYPVYVDGRTDLYDDQLLRDYLNTYLAQSGWDERLYQDGIATVLVEETSPLAQVLRTEPEWDRVYDDDRAVIYTRRSPLEPEEVTIDALTARPTP